VHCIMNGLNRSFYASKMELTVWTGIHNGEEIRKEKEEAFCAMIQ